MNRLIFSELINKYRSSQFSKNIIRSMVLYSINTFFIFLSYPVYISYLGIETYAVWSLLSVIISFAELGNFGMGNALVSLVSVEYKQGNSIAIGKIISNAFYITITSLLVIFPILLIFNYQIIDLLKIPIKYRHISEEIIPYIYIIISLYLVNDNLKSIIVGIGRLDISNFIFVSSNILKLLIAISLLACGNGLYSLLFSVIIANMFVLIFYIVIIKKNNVKFYFYPIDIRLIKEIFVFGSKMIGISVMNMLMMPISKIILADINLASVAYFELGSKVVYAISGIIQKGVYAFLPQMSKYKNDIASNLQKIKESCAKLSNKIIFICIILFIILDVTAIYWMKLWLGETYNIEILFSFYILQVGALFSIYSLPYYYTLMGLNRENICLYEAVIRCLVNILLLWSLLFISHKSIIIYLCFTISTIISNSFVIIKSRRLLNTDFNLITK